MGLPLVFIEIKTIKRGLGICHHLKGRTADVSREEEERHQAVLLTAVINRGPEDEEGARASGRILRAIRTEMMGPLNEGVLHTFYVHACLHTECNHECKHARRQLPLKVTALVPHSQDDPRA